MTERQVHTVRKQKQKYPAGQHLKIRTFGEPLLYLWPFLLIISIFMIYPIVTIFSSSFLENYNYMRGEFTSIGFDNFRQLFQDPSFLSSLKNTFFYVATVVPVTTCLALMIAVFLNQKIRFQAFYQLAYFLPMVTALIAVGTVWKWMYHYDYGIINFFLTKIGVAPVRWMEDPQMAPWALTLYGIWNKLPFTIILFLSGLQTIDKQYYTAAKVDGAKSGKVFFRITLPLLAPTVALVTIINVINTSKVFNEVFALFNGKPGPAYSLYTVVYYIYENFYKKWDVAIACAAAIILFLIVFVLTLLQTKLQKRSDYR